MREKSAKKCKKGVDGVLKRCRVLDMKAEQLLEILEKRSGAFPVGLITETDTKARKTNNPFGKIYKGCRSVGWVGVDYTKAVNREAERQGIESNFVSRPLPWGEWYLNKKVVRHKGEFYLATETTPGAREKQKAKILYYRAENGQFISPEEAEKFIPKKKTESARQDEIGLEEKILVRTYKFSSIKKIRINGRTHVME